MVSLGNVCIHDAFSLTPILPGKYKGGGTDKDFLVPKDAYHYQLCVCVCGVCAGVWVCVSLFIYFLVNVSTHGHFSNP